MPALSLFPHLGMALVWEKLVHSWGTRTTRPTAAALRHLRARPGPTPFRALFEVLAVPLLGRHAGRGLSRATHGGLRRDHCRHQRHPNAVDELLHGALDTNLPARPLERSL
ncbi:hypothetical protein [Saccharopolyspora shandongensis]|uniref:hypothetical protein n=1 Tax=Saccharopolyspora shandongensis TaxID=418495 RepID=UPI0033C3B9C3